VILLSKRPTWWPENLHRHKIPILVWLGAIVCVSFLLNKRNARFNVMGIVSSREYTLSATTTGRLKSVAVGVFERVAEGQILAVIDDAPLRARIAMAGAEIKRLEHELAAARDEVVREEVSIKDDQSNTLRRLAVDEEEARLRALEIRTVLEPDRIRLRELELETKAARALSDQDLISRLKFSGILEKQNAQTQKILENELLLSQAEQTERKARDRYQVYLNANRQDRASLQVIDTRLAVIRGAIDVQDRRIEELERQLDGLILTAPFSAIVTLIDLDAGEAVMPGRQIMTLVESQPREIVAYQSPDLTIPEPGTLVEVVKYSQPLGMGRCRVIRSESALVEVPLRLRRIRNLAQWGQPFLVEILPEMKLKPGEIVGIRQL